MISREAAQAHRAGPTSFSGHPAHQAQQAHSAAQHQAQVAQQAHHYAVSVVKSSGSATTTLPQMTLPQMNIPQISLPELPTGGPGGSSNRLIEALKNSCEDIEPIIALSKLDECEIGPEEFSKLAELNSKIGIITGTNDIVNSLALSSENVLTQYLKENC